MKEFPPILSTRHINKFTEIYYNRVLCYLRRDLYELDHPTQRDVLEKMMRPDPVTGKVTGIDGINRDIF